MLVMIMVMQLTRLGGGGEGNRWFSDMQVTVQCGGVEGVICGFTITK